YQNDRYSDGQLFMKSRAGAFLNAGGLAISGAGGGTGGTGGTGGSGGTGGTAGSGGTGGTCSAPPGPGTGLTGEYFKDMTLTTRQLTRTDATVDFNWANGSPDPSLPADGFSVRWSGRVTARTGGAYTFYTVSDD